MLPLITVALATFTVVLFVLGLLPFRPGRLMPVVVTGAAYGVYLLDQHYPVPVQAAAAASIVGIVSRFAVSELPEPWKLDDILGAILERTAQVRVPRRPRPVTPPRGANRVGNRIPPLG